MVLGRNTEDDRIGRASALYGRVLGCLGSRHDTSTTDHEEKNVASRNWEDYYEHPYGIHMRAERLYDLTSATAFSLTGGTSDILSPAYSPATVPTVTRVSKRNVFSTLRTCGTASFSLADVVPLRSAALPTSGVYSSSTVYVNSRLRSNCTIHQHSSFPYTGARTCNSRDRPGLMYRRSASWTAM